MLKTTNLAIGGRSDRVNQCKVHHKNKEQYTAEHPVQSFLQLRCISSLGLCGLR